MLHYVCSKLRGSSFSREAQIKLFPELSVRPACPGAVLGLLKELYFS